MDNTKENIFVISLCSGGGGLEKGVARALGVNLIPLVYVEREAFACEYLASEIEQGRMVAAPIKTDLTDKSLEEFHRELQCVASEYFTVLCAGFPCQPHSSAGRQKHREDRRWIWPSIARWICNVRPSIVILENVPGLLIGGAYQVFRDLASAGYIAGWDLYTAEETGAPHERKRVFIVAILGNSHSIGGTRQIWERIRKNRNAGRKVEYVGCHGRREQYLRIQQRKKRRSELGNGHGFRRENGEVATKSKPEERNIKLDDSSCGRRIGDDRREYDQEPEERYKKLANGDCTGKQEQFSRIPETNWRGGRFLPEFPPAKNDYESWRKVISLGRSDLLPAVSRKEAFESPVLRLANGLAFRNRSHGIRLFGEGVVPQQACIAIRGILDQIFNAIDHYRFEPK